MTSHWGPMGWMTLHSISVCYPEIPSKDDKEILYRFMNLFKESIACPSCRNHFTSMFDTYTQRHLDWANSRFNVFVTMCRLHNTVNKRLEKPSPSTVREALQTLITATSVTPARVFRRNYINYIISNWARQGDGEGRIFSNSGRHMLKIDIEYWSLREVLYSDISFPEANILEIVPENPQLYNIGNGLRPIVPSSLKNVGFRIRNGKLSLGSI
jgi:Erv1 / Alr family